MRIEIDMAERQPPAGQICADGQRRLAFSGWLELLQILADVVGSDAADCPPPLG